MRTLNFSDIVLKDIDGTPVKNCTFHKTVANVLYTQAASVDFVEIAIKINRGEAVELSPAQVAEVERCVFLPASKIATHARKAFQDFIAGE